MPADDIDPVPAEATDGAKVPDATESVSAVGPVAEPVTAAPFAGPAGPWGVVGATPVPPRERRISRRAKVVSAAGAVVAALIAGLIVWSPWKPDPPTAVRVTSPTATSVVVSWQAPSGNIVGPSNYLVLRSGRQVGSVPAGTTSWTDHGLAPGATYSYTVVAAGLGHSAPSAAATATTITPSPVRLTAHPTHTTVDLHWSPSPLGPAPDRYVISNGTTVVATLPGTTTSYTDQAQPPGTSFNYTVVAQWGNYLSGPSAAAGGATIAAPLGPEVPVHVDTTGSPGSSWGSIVVGYHWDDTWSATPACIPSGCPVMTMMISVGPGGTFQNASMPMTLHSSGSGYSGTATAKVTGCQTSTSVIPYVNTVTLVLTPAKGKVRNGAWTAWTGTMTMNAPYMDEGDGYYCPSGTWTFALTSGLSPAHSSAALLLSLP
jgi:Fibronectin type III domain